MADQKNHSFISNSRLRKFVFTGILFSLPVLIILISIEILLSRMDFAEKIKNEYIEQNSEDIEILFLGSSQVERAINPEYISMEAINLANSSQTLFEDFELLKEFSKQLKSLKLVVLEISYDKLERDKSHVSPLIDHKNLKFYDVNTFGRSLKIQDYFLFHSNPKYFSDRLEDYVLKNDKIQLNQYGFDENKFEGAFTYGTYILIENINNEINYKKNLETLHNIIDFCSINKLDILVYHPPTYNKYNELRDPKLIKKWINLLNTLKAEYPEIKFLIQDKNPNYSREFFSDGNHLNPKGAKKATNDLNEFLLQHYK